MKNESLEFFKLDEIDRKVVFNLMANNPKALASYVEWLINHYSSKRGVTLDKGKLLREIADAVS